MLKLRCSALPIAFRCAGAVRRADLPVDETTGAADLGKAGHEAVRLLVEAGRIDWDGLAELAAEHGGVNVNELRAVLVQARALWAEVGASFPNALTEIELPALERPSFVLTGHTDVLSIVPALREARVGDWKFGRKDHDYREQLLGYAALVLEAYPEVDTVTAGVLWVRDCEYEHYSLSREQLPAWQRRVESAVVRWNGVYRAGPQCAFCPRGHECPARNALVRRDVAVLADVDLDAFDPNGDTLAQFEPADILELVERADRAKRAAETVREAVRRHVERNGDIVAGDRRLTVQQDDKRHLRVVQGFSLLSDEFGFGDAEWERVLKFSLPEVESIVAKRAPYRGGAAAVRALRERLEAEQLIETEPVAKLVSRRA